MSHIIEIPGGTAEFYDKDELTPRRQRPMQEMALQLADLLDRLKSASIVSSGGQTDEATANLPGLTAPPVDISAQQAHDLTVFGDVVLFMWLKSWSLEIPFPANPDGLLDIPGPVYTVLSTHAAKLHAKSQESQFDPSEEALADPASPTGDSGV